MQLFYPRRILLAAALALLALVASPGQAALVVSSETVLSAAGDSGFVEISLTNGFGTTQTLSGFSVDLSLGGSGVTLTGVDNLTADPYVFDGFGTGFLTADSFPNSGFNLSDFALNAEGFVELTAGQTAGLGRIAFTVDPSASGGLRPITFNVGPTTQFVDEDNIAFADADVTLVSGGVNVIGAVATVPEPTSMAIWGLALGCGVFARSRRKVA